METNDCLPIHATYIKNVHISHTLYLPYFPYPIFFMLKTRQDASGSGRKKGRGRTHSHLSINQCQQVYPHKHLLPISHQVTHNDATVTTASRKESGISSLPTNHLPLTPATKCSVISVFVSCNPLSPPRVVGEKKDGDCHNDIHNKEEEEGEKGEKRDSNEKEKRENIIHVL